MIVAKEQRECYSDSELHEPSSEHSSTHASTHATILMPDLCIQLIDMKNKGQND